MTTHLWYLSSTVYPPASLYKPPAVWSWLWAASVCNNSTLTQSNCTAFCECFTVRKQIWTRLKLGRSWLTYLTCVFSHLVHILNICEISYKICIPQNFMFKSIFYCSTWNGFNFTCLGRAVAQIFTFESLSDFCDILYFYCSIMFY